jgi:hypothetical protein
MLKEMWKFSLNTKAESFLLTTAIFKWNVIKNIQMTIYHFNISDNYHRISRIIKDYQGNQFSSHELLIVHP